MKIRPAHDVTIGLLALKGGKTVDVPEHIAATLIRRDLAREVKRRTKPKARK